MFPVEDLVQDNIQLVPHPAFLLNEEYHTMPTALHTPNQENMKKYLDGIVGGSVLLVENNTIGSSPVNHLNSIVSNKSFKRDDAYDVTHQITYPKIVIDSPSNAPKFAHTVVFSTIHTENVFTMITVHIP